MFISGIPGVRPLWTHAPNSISGALLVDARARRRGELHKLRDSAPALLVAMYRRIAALSEEQSLPTGISFVSLVEAIIDHGNLLSALCHEPYEA